MRSVSLGAIGVAVLVAACGSTGDSAPVAPARHTVGGVVSGLVGTGLVLQNSGAGDLSVTSSGSFSFASPVAEGATYAVTVKTQPVAPAQTCTVSNGAGTMGTSNITSVAVTCVTNAVPSHTIGGNVTGLAGSGMVLRNSGVDDLAVASNGAFAFSTPAAEGATYAVTVKTQPVSPPQTCTVSNGVGTVGTSNVTTVAVACVTNAPSSYTVGGTVNGLIGSGLVLQNNGSDDRAVSAGGAFTFSAPLAVGATYRVSVKTQPGFPSQSCSVTGGTGTVGASNVVDISVSCRTRVLYFVASDGTSGLQLWRSDGSEAGTGIVVATPSAGGEASNPTSLSIVGDKLYFAAHHSTGGGYDPRALWKTDGTATGTVFVAIADVGTSGIVDVAGIGYFAGGAELYKTDGTGSGTLRVADINAGPYGSSPMNLVAVGSTLFFTADDGVHGRELWKSDGTASGTQMVVDLEAGPSDGVVRGWQPLALGGQAYFLSTAGGTGMELWRSDGTTSGTVLVKDVNPGPGTGVQVNVPGVLFGGRLFFAGNDGSHGYEPWSSDGTSGGTGMVKDINTGALLTNPYEFTVRGGYVYFVDFDDTHGTELWRSDGTSSGTVLVSDVCPGTCSSTPGEVTAAASTLYFVADDGVHGRELWKTDGTEAGTAMVKDIVPGSASASPSGLVAVDDTVYFGITDASGGAQLWKSDGTAAGTVMVHQICSGSFCTGVSSLVIH